MIDLVGSIADAMTAQSSAGAIKVEADLERYKRIIEATQPDLIVECGTYMGLSALWFAQTGGCPVVTVDVNPQVRWETWERWDYRITPIIGSSTDPDVVAEVAGIAADHERVMVVLDSDHSTAHVAAELEVYPQLVTPGCYLVVEDTLLRVMPWLNIEYHIDGNPADALEAWLPDHPEFANDVELEELTDRTQHLGGWLRRAS